MIQPINQNNNSSKTLQPVEVPHFTGHTVTTPVKLAKKIKIPAKDTVSFTKQKEAIKRGAEDGANVIKDVTKKGIDFTGAFVKSFCEDIQGVVKEKGTRTITAINEII